MDDNANEQAAAAEQEEEQEAAHHHMDRDKQEQEQQWRRPPPPPPFLRSAHPSFSPLPSPRQSPPRPASPSALQPIAEVNARRTAQLLRDAARDQELERARRAPLLIEGASQSSPPEASPASFSSPHAAGAGKRKSDHSGTTTVEDRFAAATRRLLHTPSLVPFADGGETPFSAMSMHQRGGGDDEEEGEQLDTGEGAPRMSLPPNDGQGEWDQEEDATHPQHQQQLSPRTRLRKWRAAVRAPQQQKHHIASHFLEGADARLARAAARRGSTGGGAAIGGAEGGHGDVWDGHGIVQGAGEKESVEEFGEAA